MLCPSGLFLRTTPPRWHCPAQIQVPLNDCGTFCVAVCNKNEVRAQKADNNDISKFTDPLKLQKLPKAHHMHWVPHRHPARTFTIGMTTWHGFLHSLCSAAELFGHRSYSCSQIATRSRKR